MIEVALAATRMNPVAENLTFQMGALIMGRLIERFKTTLRWLKVKSKRGVSAIEYGLLAALVALGIIAAVTTVGTNLKAVFTSISTQV